MAMRSDTTPSRSTGRCFGHGEPVRVKQGERVLFHVLNGSAGEIRSLVLPGHTFTIIAMDETRFPSRLTLPASGWELQNASLLLSR